MGSRSLVSSPSDCLRPTKSAATVVVLCLGLQYLGFAEELSKNVSTWWLLLATVYKGATGDENPIPINIAKTFIGLAKQAVDVVPENLPKPTRGRSPAPTKGKKTN